MGSIAMGIVLIYLHLALFVTYQLAMLYWAKKTILIIIQILNGVLFVSPFVLHRYEVLRAVERNATGLDAMPLLGLH